MNTKAIFRCIPSGDSAFIIKAGDEISVQMNQTIRKLLFCIDQEEIGGITDVIPSYNELMICYDPTLVGFRKILDRIHAFETDIETIQLPEPVTFHVPVLYGGDSGPDLSEVAQFHKLTEQEVVRIHSAGIYLVYMIGFTPGFCYLGGMDDRIATPRKASPRLKIAGGAIGIAGKQTGIYPIESPGGWQLIGQTPLRLFDPYRKPEFLFNTGDLIRFIPVNKKEFGRIQKGISEGMDFNPYEKYL